MVDHYGVVDHEVDGNLRVDHIGAAAKVLGRITHRCEINNGRHTGKVLHENARRAVSNLVTVLAFIVQPGLERDDVVFRNRFAILVAQHILQKHFQRSWQARHIAQTIFPGGFKGVVGV